MSLLTQGQVPPTAQEQPREKSGEVRLGLVLFGGASLAIYMNGIAQEFFHAVQGSGVFKLIKAVTDSEIIVDIISGTSAGGINGIFLAYALTNRADFSQCSKLWLEQGNIGRLLRSPLHGPVTSMLNSEGYYLPKLQAAFQAMGGRKRSPLDPFESPVNELDLFVTGTDFYGETHTEFDDAGHAIDIMQHRALFKLKHRANRADYATDFRNDPPTHQSLGKLAQITSAFPFAFAPVTVTGPNDLLAHGNEALQPVDEKLRRWGQLTGRKHFVDGGVLANKPFTPTIEAIFNRAAEREVDRYLCYVEPDPECFVRTNAPFPPQALQNTVAALSTLPRYQSISADLNAIAEHNSQIEEFARFCQQQPRPAPADPWNLGDPLYRQARLMSISNRAVEGILKVSGTSVRLTGAARKAAADLIQSFDRMMLGTSEHDGNACRSLRDFDLYFRRRRLFDQIYRIYDRLYAREHNPNLADQYQPLWRRINERNGFLEVVQYHMERMVDRANFEWQSKFEGITDERRKEEAAICLWRQVQALLRHLLNIHGNGEDDNLDPVACAPANLDRLSAALRQRTNQLIKAMPAQDPPDFQNVLFCSDEAEEEIMKEMQAVDEELAAVYHGFAAVDQALFPAQFLSRLNSRDTLKVIRFSPVDADTGLTKGLQSKILGRQFGDFGGFLKKSWRANDICFGRLDGAAQLITLLLSGKAAARNQNQSANVRNAILTESGEFRRGMSPQELFPHSDALQMRELIMDLLEGRWTEAVQSKLVEAAQVEIFYEELKRMEIDPSTVKRFESEQQFLQNGYKIRQESWKSLLRPASLPVFVKGLAALSMVALGLKLIQPANRMGKSASK